MAELRVERMVQAPVEVVWSVISDVVGYAEVAPNLSKAEIMSGDGLGMCRRCYDSQGRGWNETCVLWEEGHRYSFVVDTSDYPYPLTKMQGTWGLVERPEGVLITMCFDFMPKYGPIGWLWTQLSKPAFRHICEVLLDNWKVKIKAQMGQATHFSLPAKTTS